MIDDVPYDPGNGCRLSEFPAKEVKRLKIYETLKIVDASIISGLWIDASSLVQEAGIGIYTPSIVTCGATKRCMVDGEKLTVHNKFVGS